MLGQLEALRARFGYVMPVNSGYRCPMHPDEVKKAHPGQHTVGAIDVGVSGILAPKLVWAGIECEWTGFGLQQKGPLDRRFVHLDHGAPRSWTY